MLNINKISKTFNGKQVLNNISLTIPTGHIALLLGGSGVGKSTLLRILCNLEAPDEGTILLNSKPLKDYSSHTVGMVFQHFNLFKHLPVERNITLALEKVFGWNSYKAHEHAHKLLTKYKLADKASQPISSLSGGQKQRLAIARALALNPKILCMDEPTSALDPLLTSYVAQEIQNLAQEGYTVIVSTHDMSLLSYLDCTIYLIDHGEIIQKASSKDIQADPQKFKHISNFISGTSAKTSILSPS